jgi:hypothetical protein
MATMSRLFFSLPVPAPLKAVDAARGRDGLIVSCVSGQV